MAARGEASARRRGGSATDLAGPPAEGHDGHRERHEDQRRRDPGQARQEGEGPARQPRERQADDGDHRRPAPHDAARSGRQPDDARQHPREASAASRRQPRARHGRLRPPMREKREVGAEEARHQQDAREVGHVHGEAPIHAVGAVGGEPEEGEVGKLVDLLAERHRRREHVRGQALQPRVDGEVVDGLAGDGEHRRRTEDGQRHHGRGNCQEQARVRPDRSEDAANDAHEVCPLRRLGTADRPHQPPPLRPRAW